MKRRSRKSAEVTVGADRMGRVELHYAALDDAPERILELVRMRGADPNVRDGNGMTPLHFAAQQFSVAAARQLLEVGATADVADTHGRTPLWIAVYNSRGRGELITLLRAAGADPEKPNNTGVSPLALARLIANYDVVQYFRDLTASRG